MKIVHLNVSIQYCFFEFSFKINFFDNISITFCRFIFSFVANRFCNVVECVDSNFFLDFSNFVNKYVFFN